jgi:outer membrane protein assembly factor BamA
MGRLNTQNPLFFLHLIITSPKMRSMKRVNATILMVLILLFLSSNFQRVNAQEQATPTQVKTGWNFGALPTITFDSDLGFQYGALVNLYNYGDGSRYPMYNHSLYFEVSRFTKGSGINRFFYDSDQLLKGVRTTFDLSYITDRKMDFYGFNGYEAAYHADFTDTENKDYISRVFYAYDRKFFRMKADFQGNLSGPKLHWVAGVEVYNFKTGPVDLKKLNKGKKPGDEKYLVDTTRLYDKFVDWGFISADEKDGGWVNYLKAGVSYDTRDNEPNPMKGIWTEAVIQVAPGFLGNGDFGHVRFSITHRQYFTLIKNDLSFAYRVQYQQTLSGNAPFYADPLVMTSFLRGTTSEGLGGSKSIRGILRNRIVGDGFLMGNFELRWKFVRFRALNQNIYLALNAFYDGGWIIDPIKVDKSLVVLGPGEQLTDYFDKDKDSLHSSVGGGFRIAMNENFIIAADFGKALDPRDGNIGFYIGLNYLF